MYNMAVKHTALKIKAEKNKWIEDTAGKIVKCCIKALPFKGLSLMTTYKQHNTQVHIQDEDMGLCKEIWLAPTLYYECVVLCVCVCVCVCVEKAVWLEKWSYIARMQAGQSGPIPSSK